MNGPYHRAKNASRKNPRTFGSLQSITPESIRRQLQESVTIGELCNIKLKTKVQLNPLSTACQWSIRLVTDCTMYIREKENPRLKLNSVLTSDHICMLFVALASVAMANDTDLDFSRFIL